MSGSLDGPRRPASSGKTTSLVVFLHGYGSDGQDLFGLAGPLSSVLPDSAFASPNAPEPCELGGPGFQWFAMTGQPGARKPASEADPDKAAALLAVFLETELARYGLEPSRLALVGFSQGAMMALHVGLRLPQAPAALVGFSGLLARPGQGTPPVLLVHGTADQVVPFSNLAAAEAGLRRAGVPVETLARPGLAHGIDAPGLQAAAGFLARHLGR